MPNLATTYPTRESWLAARRLGLGASDAPKVLGVVPSRFNLWVDKAEPEKAPPDEAGEAAEWGLRLEAVIGEVYAERSGRHVVMATPYTIHQHADLSWMLATPDADQEENRLLEIKSTSAYLERGWKNGPPLPYQIQLQHQLAVCDKPRGTIAVLIGGQKLLWFDVERNDAFIDVLITHEKAFWELVCRKEPPGVDGTEECRKALESFYGLKEGESVDLPEAAVDWTEKLDNAKLIKSEAEAAIRECKNQLLGAIGEASIGFLPDGSGWRRSEVTREAFTVEASSHYQLRRVKK